MNPLLSNVPYSGYSADRSGTPFGPNLVPVYDGAGNIVSYKTK
jgi:hypothetical protein